jgi:predicted nucleic acid-binding protein
VAERPAVNTSPLVFLSRAGLLELLQVAGDRLVVPAAVMDEIVVRGPSDPTVRAVSRTSWLTVVETPAAPHLVQAWDLGKGESSVLAWGRTYLGTEIIIDDLAGRRCAAALGIPVRGTLGLVIVAKKRAIIPHARPVIDRLRQSGMYPSDRLVNDVLGWVQE